MRKGPHGIEHVSGVGYATFNRRYCLFEGSVRVAHRGNDAIARRAFHKFERTGKFRRKRDDADEPVRSGDEFVEEFLRGWRDGIERMHATPRWVYERPFQMDSQHFGGES